MYKVYLLYDCDAWRSHNSIEAGSPIITAFSEETFARMLLQDLELASTLSEENQRLYDEIIEEADEILEKVFELYNQQRIDCRIVYSFEEAYQP
jgi:hypothetical protein